MATLESIIRNRRGKAGSNGSWKVTNGIGNGYHCLWHYSTPMLEWYDTGYGVEVIAYDEGHGSVSDQQGMNIAFRTLGVPYYYSRKGGARIRRTTSQEGLS